MTSTISQFYNLHWAKKRERRKKNPRKCCIALQHMDYINSRRSDISGTQKDIKKIHSNHRLRRCDNFLIFFFLSFPFYFLHTNAKLLIDISRAIIYTYKTNHPPARRLYSRHILLPSSVPSAYKFNKNNIKSFSEH